MPSDTPQVTRPRSGSPVPPPKPVDKKEIDWVRALAGAGKESGKTKALDDARNDIIGNATGKLKNSTGELDGLKFDMTVKGDANLKAKLLSLMGKQSTMTTLTGTGDAMKEIDTYHDLDKLETVDPEKLKKAGESMRVIVEAGQEIDAKLMELYCKEEGIDPKEIAALQKALEKKRADEKDPVMRAKKKQGWEEPVKKGEKDAVDPETLKKYEAMRAKIEKTVRDEVYAPMVREGLMPENFVPDKYSEVAQTFEGASDAYMERLEEYTKELDENAEKLKHLGIAKEVVSKTFEGAKGVLQAIPGGGDLIQHVETGLMVADTLTSGAFDVAEQVIKKDDALSIAQTVARTISGALKATGQVPDGVLSCIDQGLSIAITGGRVVKGLSEGNSQDVLNALADGLAQSLTLAGTFTDIPNLEIIKTAASKALKNAGLGAALLKALKSGDKAAIQKALSAVVQAGIDTLGTLVTTVVKEEVGGQTGEDVEQGIEIGTKALNGFIDGAIMKDPKKMATALGGLANDCCSAYVPGDLGPALGSAVQSAIGSVATVGLAIEKCDPQGIVDALVSALQDGVKTALGEVGKTQDVPDLTLIQTAIAKAVNVGGLVAALGIALKKKPADEKAVKAALGALVKGGIEAAGAIVTETVKTTVGGKTGEDVETGVGIGTTAMEGFVDAMLSEDKVGGMVKALGGLAQSCCSTYLPSEYGTLLGKSLNTALSGGADLGKAMLGGDPEAVLKTFGKLASDALDNVAESLKDSNPDASKAITEASSAVKGGAGALSGAAALRKAMKEGPSSAIEKAFKEMLNSLLDPIVSKIKPEDLAKDSEAEDGGGDAEEGGEEEESEDGTAEVSKQAAKEQEQYEGDLKAIIEKANKAIKAGGPQDKIAAATKARDAAIKELLEQNMMKSEIAGDSAAFSDMLNNSMDGGDDDGDTRTLKSLIATIQKDRATLNMVDSLASMGIAAAAHFFPPLGAVLDFKKFAMEVAKTVEHMRLLLEWQRNAQEARNAVTVQVHAMLNRVKLEDSAVIEHSMKAAIALISAIGQVVAAVGAHAAPVGVAMTAGAKIAGTALDVALKVKTAAEMEIAWRAYQKALKDPRDRKAIRMAIQKNPTMAKYAMVWGALNDGNPIAKKVLKRCGLTDAIIAKESSNVAGVVEYLEVLYNDDPIVLRAVPDTTEWGWKAPKPELTLRCWTTFLSAAQKDGKPKMKAGTGGAVTAAFGGLEKAQGELAKAKSARLRLEKFVQSQAAANTEAMMGKDEKAKAEEKPKADKRVALLQVKLDAALKAEKEKQEAVLAAYLKLKKDCLGFKPVNDKDEPYVRVGEYLDALAALAEIAVRELGGETVGLERDAA